MEMTYIRHSSDDGETVAQIERAKAIAATLGLPAREYHGLRCLANMYHSRLVEGDRLEDLSSVESVAGAKNRVERAKRMNVPFLVNLYETDVAIRSDADYRRRMVDLYRSEILSRLDAASETREAAH